MASFGGLRGKPRLHDESQNKVISSFLDHFRLSDAKLSTRKVFVQGRLVSLTPRMHTIFEKTLKNAADSAVLVCYAAANYYT